MWEELLDLADIDMLKSVVREALIRRDPNLARISSRRFTVNQTLDLAARRRGADDVMLLLPASVLANLVPPTLEALLKRTKWWGFEDNKLWPTRGCEESTMPDVAILR